MGKKKEKTGWRADRKPTGKRIVELQMTLALLASATRDVFKVAEDPHGRRPFQHAATEGIEVLNGGARAHLLHHKQIAALSQRYGLEEVVRWNPRKVSSVVESTTITAYFPPVCVCLTDIDLVPTAAGQSSGIRPRDGPHAGSLCDCGGDGAGTGGWRGQSNGPGAHHRSSGSAGKCRRGSVGQLSDTVEEVGGKLGASDGRHLSSISEVSISISIVSPNMRE